MSTIGAISTHLPAAPAQTTFVLPNKDTTTVTATTAGASSPNWVGVTG